MTDPPGGEEDPLIDVLMRLARADFSKKVPRTMSADRDDTVAYLVNTVSEELSRMMSSVEQHRDELARAVEAFAEVLAAHAAGNFDARLERTEDGSPLDVLAFIVNNTGEETGRLFNERNRAFEDLRVAKESEAINEARSAFLANVSHELRTPLTLILGPVASVLGRDDVLDAKSREQLEIALRNANRLTNMVNDLLDFTRAEEGKLEVRWQRLDPSRLLSELVVDVGPVAEERDLALETQIEDVGDVALDRRMFEKIALNFIGNALKFTPRGGRVVVTLSSDGTDLVMSVSDTGIGIADADQARIFERFQQLDSTQSRRFEGSGLGLALVRDFAQAMGGAVSVQSRLGEGSTFTVRLPESPVAPLIDAPLEEAPPPSGRYGRQLDASAGPETETSVSEGTDLRTFVLLAEDNADMRRYILNVLRDEFDVHAVSDGQLALEALAGRVPDVILSDVMMPRLDGFELVKRVKADERLRSVPIVLLTARAGVEATSEGLNAGADDYLAKPFSPRELIARVRAAARLHDATKQLALTLDELQVTKTRVVSTTATESAVKAVLWVSTEMRKSAADGDTERQSELETMLGRLDALYREPADGHVELAAVCGELLNLDSSPSDPLSMEGDAKLIGRALGVLVQTLSIPCDGSGRVEVETLTAGITVRLMGPPGWRPSAAARAACAPKPSDGQLEPLLVGAAHVALLRSGLEPSIEEQGLCLTSMLY